MLCSNNLIFFSFFSSIFGYNNTCANPLWQLLNATCYSVFRLFWFWPLNLHFEQPKCIESYFLVFFLMLTIGCMLQLLHVNASTMLWMSSLSLFIATDMRMHQFKSLLLKLMTISREISYHSIISTCLWMSIALFFRVLSWVGHNHRKVVYET